MGGGGVRVGGGGGQGGCELRIEVFVKIKKKNWGGGGTIFEPKTLSMYLKKIKKVKKKKENNLTEPGLEPTTSGLEKPALLSTWLNTIIAITKYE